MQACQCTHSGSIIRNDKLGAFFQFGILEQATAIVAQHSRDAGVRVPLCYMPTWCLHRALPRLAQRHRKRTRAPQQCDDTTNTVSLPPRAAALLYEMSI